jgi:hypothetical protein
MAQPRHGGLTTQVVGTIKEDESLGGSHRHVTWIRLANGGQTSKTQAIALMRLGARHFVVESAGGRQELRVDRCPRCGLDQLWADEIGALTDPLLRLPD